MHAYAPFAGCCFQSSCPGLPLLTEAHVMMPIGIDFRASVHLAGIRIAVEAQSLGERL